MRIASHHTTLNTIMVYLAAPLFTPEQNATLDVIESILDDAGIAYFSPRRGGINMAGLEGQDRLDAAQHIFDINEEMMDKCNVMIANIDDRDIGTAFEIGRFTGKDQSSNILITYSNNNYGLNIMINNCGGIGHFGKVDQLREVLTPTVRGGNVIINNLSDLRARVRKAPSNQQLANNADVEKDLEELDPVEATVAISQPA